MVLGSPNSKILPGHILSENKKIIDTKPTFYQIQQNYLKNLSGEDLKLLDEFLDDVVNAGDYNSACSNFYNNDWKNYLRNNSSQQENISPEKANEFFRLARYYYYGWEGYSKDKEKAFDLYLEAAKAGHRGAIDDLSSYYSFYIN